MRCENLPWETGTLVEALAMTPLTLTTFASNICFQLAHTLSADYMGLKPRPYRLLNRTWGPKDVARKSLVFYAVSGNDYAAYRRSSSNGSTDVLPEIVNLVASVVGQITLDLTQLYDMGFRSFVVGKMAPAGVHALRDRDEEFQLL